MKVFGSIEFTDDSGPKSLKLERLTDFPTGENIHVGSMFWLAAGSFQGPYILKEDGWRQLALVTAGIMTGVAELDFGSAPGGNVATVTVTDVPGVGADSVILCTLSGDVTDTHNAYEHLMVPMNVRASNVVVGTGFDIVAMSEWRLSGTFKVRWALQ